MLVADPFRVLLGLQQPSQATPKAVHGRDGKSRMHKTALAK